MYMTIVRIVRCASDPYHLRFAQYRALGRKVSDEFTVPLCRGHHREVHRCVDPTAAARALWLRPIRSQRDRGVKT